MNDVGIGLFSSRRAHILDARQRFKSQNEFIFNYSHILYFPECPSWPASFFTGISNNN